MQLVQRERGVSSLDSARIRVKGGIQGALGRGEVAEDPIQRLGSHSEVVGMAGVLPGVEIGPSEQGLVGEHLLEVRHQPVGIGGVTAEAAHHVVVDATGRHGVEGPARHVPCAAQHRRLRPDRVPLPVLVLVLVPGCRRHSSIRVGRGNFGAGPNPPHSGSKPVASPDTTRPAHDAASLRSGPARVIAANDGCGSLGSRSTFWSSRCRVSARRSSLATASTTASA